MEKRIRLFSIVALIAVGVSAVPSSDDEAVWIHNGFAIGENYLEWSNTHKCTYAMGAINGMMLAPLFGAPKEKMKWLESYTENMTGTQVAAIISKFLEENPGRWHEDLNVLTYSALRQAYNKNRPEGKE